MMKKIGCVIAYKKGHTNYGTSLQGFSLVYVLQKRGYEVNIINYKKQLSFWQKIKFVINAVRSSGLLFFIKKNIWNFSVSNSQYKENIKLRVRAVENYKEKKLYPYFKTYKGYENLKKGSKEYDAVIVGSDQVWRPESLVTNYFNLLFVDDNIKKIAYGSSFGVSKIPSFQYKKTRNYLARFHRIGVREIQGQKIIASIAGINSIVVADPTLLLTKDEWVNEMKESTINTEEPYIFCYFLGKNTEARKAVEKLQKLTNYKIIALRHMDEFIASDEKFGDEAPYDVSPNDFIHYISNAKYVCTDSFHCTLFSCVFHKQFMTFYRFKSSERTSRNSRIDSLFEVLSINNEHLYVDDITQIFNPIAWDVVDEKIQTLRNKSLEFLVEAIEN